MSKTSDYTPYKQNCFRSIVRIHLSIVNNIFKKYPDWRRVDFGHYWYFDTTASNGIVNNIKGSPLIFCEEAYRYPNIQFHNVLIDDKIDEINELRDNMGFFFDKDNFTFDILCMDNKEALKEYSSKIATKIRYGLLYNDPQGVTNWEAIIPFFEDECYSRTDILLNVNATAIKKCRKCRITAPTNGLSLIDGINLINKKYWSIRDISDLPKNSKRWQWSFILGTNWKSFPTFSNLGFCDIKGFSGQDIINKLNYTKKEVENGEDGN